ncbi:MAG: DNA polymerase/3'-5' exonuclease PolX [Phycisphaera sp.]|nr:DNA polymerase/3'-5' exonuclease PolX [Phycisphaera sp.]
MSTNRELAARFEQMAQLMELLGVNRFKVIAYQRGSRTLEDLTTDVASLVNKDNPTDLKALTDIDGIGKGLAEKIAEFVTTGRIAEHDGLLDKVPKGLLPLFDIPGLGPKTIALLWHEAGVESVDDLKKKLDAHALDNLPGFGQKKIDNLRKNLAFAEQASQRVRLGQALPFAEALVNELRKLPGVKRADYAGSLRRGQETIGDIDVIAAASPDDAAAISKAFVELLPGAEVIGQGETKTSVRLPQDSSLPGVPGVQCDLRIIDPARFGAALMYFTGSKEHNVKMRERAIKRGLTLNEYGLWKEGTEARKHDGDKGLVAGKTEQDVFQALDLKVIEPELRQDRGEIALSENDQLPELITIDDIQAELHAHTTASDGRWSIEEYAEFAIKRGYHTLAVTDHSKSQPIAHGLDEKRLENHIKAIHKAAEQYKNKIAILAGSEVDILSDGKLDYPDSLLAQLDIVVASPHVALSQRPEEATKRLLKAIENPYVTILGHPTGRLILRREGLSPDMDKVITAAKGRGIALEINANSYRLDLRDTHARAALAAGVKLAINTDAHGPEDMDQLRYGLLTARRAGATKNDVVNCMSKATLAKWIKNTRP